MGVGKYLYHIVLADRCNNQPLDHQLYLQLKARFET